MCSSANFMHAGLVNFRVSEVLEKPIEMSMGEGPEGGVEIDIFKKGVDLDGGLGGKERSTLCMLTCCVQMVEGMRVGK